MNGPRSHVSAHRSGFGVVEVPTGVGVRDDRRARHRIRPLEIRRRWHGRAFTPASRHGEGREEYERRPRLTGVEHRRVRRVAIVQPSGRFQELPRHSARQVDGRYAQARLGLGPPAPSLLAFPATDVSMPLCFRGAIPVDKSAFLRRDCLAANDADGGFRFPGLGYRRGGDKTLKPIRLSNDE